jgi:hypothetical protein
MNYTYLPRVALTSITGDHIRYVPGALAGAMVAGGSALAVGPGKVRTVALVGVASTLAHRIGEPSPPTPGGTKFYRWRRLDASASRIIEHHPRCTYE